ncbi:DUF4440 domain-containing protein [Mycobacterium kansasii]|uniref:SnoaL-like domain-containing protein n=1 Tax=Mycobacterium attenuatum TaxID=2341086 RepID=A0A498Q3P4_9MYCO|nr:nuclear transport factor 2 family protein [Mycobacterium attenuatum]ORB82702.1 DUF4440 domain-containing protein [Mycobacterium kansasii]VBA39514.1 hypothetical protein LAUMK136_03038 [Mycobacterium attenuatum]VBA54060.1 hypothetical protein LAUMK191_03010 [Mycobacterium attenuatum]
MPPDPADFCRRWAAAWNARDLDAVLAFFHEDIVFTSPFAAEWLPDSCGVIHGKHGLREYWSIGLERLPDLLFEVEAVYLGVETIVVNYRNQRGPLVNEVLIFDGDLVREGHATYVYPDSQRPQGS